MRKGMGRGQGSGWKNLRCDDSRRHSLASKGVKTAQKVPQNVKRWYMSAKSSSPKYRYTVRRLETPYPFHAGIHTNKIGKPQETPFGQQMISRSKFTAWFGTRMTGGGFEEHKTKDFNSLQDAKAWVEKNIEKVKK